MDRKPDLVVPTVAVPVRLALVGRTAFQAEMFVAGERRGRAELVDHLKRTLDKVAFAPIRAGGVVRIYNKHAISFLALPARVLDDDFGDAPSEVLELYDHEHDVEVELVGGAKLVGMLFDSAPPDRPRVGDHLNAAGAFVKLWTPDEPYLVNTAQIIQVTELTRGA